MHVFAGQSKSAAAAMASARLHLVDLVPEPHAFTVPMWAAFDCGTNDEQLLYGDLSYQPAFEPDYILGSASTECMPGVEVELALPNGLSSTSAHVGPAGHAGEQADSCSILDVTAQQFLMSRLRLVATWSPVRHPPGGVQPVFVSGCSTEFKIHCFRAAEHATECCYRRTKRAGTL